MRLAGQRCVLLFPTLLSLLSISPNYRAMAFPGKERFILLFFFSPLLACFRLEHSVGSVLCTIFCCFLISGKRMGIRGVWFWFGSMISYFRERDSACVLLVSWFVHAVFGI